MLNGLSPKTIRSSLGLLESIGLLVRYQEGDYQTIHVADPGRAHEHLFETRKEKAERSPSESRPADQKEVLFRTEDLQAIYKECRREGFAIELSREITVAAAMAGIDSIAFEGFSEQATLEHAKNRMAGKVGVEHHGHLLKYKLEQVREEQDRAEMKMMTGTTVATESTPKLSSKKQAEAHSAPMPRPEKNKLERSKSREELYHKIGDNP